MAVTAPLNPSGSSLITPLVALTVLSPKPVRHLTKPTIRRPQSGVRTAANGGQKSGKAESCLYARSVGLCGSSQSAALADSDPRSDRARPTFPPLSNQLSQGCLCPRSYLREAFEWLPYLATAISRPSHEIARP